MRYRYAGPVHLRSFKLLPVTYSSARVEGCGVLTYFGRQKLLSQMSEKLRLSTVLSVVQFSSIHLGNVVSV